MNAPSFDSSSRLILVAPHPDDESLACSVILQRATRAGARVRVIYATDGDNNPWPQRVVQRKWRLTEFDCARWGQLRRQEAMNALEVLGVDHSDVAFLGLPDQGLTNLLLSGCDQTVARFAHCITEWAPTDILGPDLSDTHPDHSALAVMLRVVLEKLPPPIRCRSIWNFLVHGNSPQFFRRAAPLRQRPQETATKIAAIDCHKTQLKLSARRFTAYAARPEYFAACGLSCDQSDQVWNASRNSGEFFITVPSTPGRSLRRRHKLFLFGCKPSGELRSVYLTVDHRSRTCMFDYASGKCIGLVGIEGSPSTDLRIAIPRNLFSFDRGLYLKLDRRGIFFDHTGWMEAAEDLDPVQPASAEIAAELSLAVS
jgi:LmbE family N-acetylglucosaminyl deacetylase